MTLRVFGIPFSTAAMSDKSLNQKFSPTTDNLVIKAIRAWLIQNNDPTYTNIFMRIYSDRNGSPGALIAQSTNSPTKSEMFSTANSGMKEIFFLFDEIVLKKDETYHAVINGTWYTGSASSHIAWRQTFPEPIYQTNVDMTFNGASSTPLFLSVIGAPL